MIPDFLYNPLPWGVGRTRELCDKMSLPGLWYTILQADLFQKLSLAALKKEAAVCESLHGKKLRVTTKSRGTTPAKMKEEAGIPNPTKTRKWLLSTTWVTLAVNSSPAEPPDEDTIWHFDHGFDRPYAEAQEALPYSWSTGTMRW